MGSPKGFLSANQLALAQAFFRQTSGFFLTGGAVLAGWELAHRSTDDLDLFTDSDDAMRAGEHALLLAAAELGGTVEAISTSPDFRRLKVRVGEEQLKVDLVRDRAVQLFDKVERDGVRTDEAREIFVNKICTLVERSEIRDVIDLLLLERRGLKVEDYLELAQKKDSGTSAATIAWLVASMRVPEQLPGGVSKDEVVSWLRSLETRMLAVAASAR